MRGCIVDPTLRTKQAGSVKSGCTVFNILVCVVDYGGMALITHVVTAIISTCYEATARVRGGTAVILWKTTKF